MKVSGFNTIFLKPGRNQSLLRRHPWIFSGAVGKVDGIPDDGQTVDVFSSDNKWLARGSYSSKSQIRVRILSFDEKESIDSAYFHRKLAQAVEHRRQIGIMLDNNAFRLVNAESDGLPGLIVDCYGKFLVCQFLSAGAEKWRESIISALIELWPCSGIYERSDSESRLKEGLVPRVGNLYGSNPSELIKIRENTLQFLVDVYKGHKTGFYLDQNLNRKAIMNYTGGKEVLNAFSYTGGFGIAAMSADASFVTNIDTSEDCLYLARKNYEMNGSDLSRVEFIREDVFSALRKYRDSRRQFDLVILDPPKFVASASQLNTGARGYKDINLLAFKLLRAGGVLVTFSCSGYVKPDLFQKIVSDAAVDAGRQAHILQYLSQGPDHAVALNFPEALYLKGLVCRVTE